MLQARTIEWFFTKAANLAFLCQHRQCAGKQRNKNLSKTILSQTDLLRTYGAVSNLNTCGKCSVNACASKGKNEFRKSQHLATLSYEIFIRYPKEFILEICIMWDLSALATYPARKVCIGCKNCMKWDHSLLSTHTSCLLSSLSSFYTTKKATI